MAAFETAGPEVGVVYSGYWKFVDASENRVYIPLPWVRRRDGWIHEELLRNNFVTTQAAVVRRECFDRSGYWLEGLPGKQEWELFLRISRDYQFRYIDEPLLNSRYDPAGISENRMGIYRSMERILELHRDDFAAHPTILAEHYVRLGLQYAPRRRVRKGARLPPPGRGPPALELEVPGRRPRRVPRRGAVQPARRPLPRPRRGRRVERHDRRAGILHPVAGRPAVVPGRSSPRAGSPSGSRRSSRATSRPRPPGRFDDPAILERLRRAIVAQKSGYWKAGDRRQISYRSGYSVLAYLAYQFPVYYFQSCHLLARLAADGLLSREMRVVDLGTGPGVLPLALITLGRHVPGSRPRCCRSSPRRSTARPAGTWSAALPSPATASASAGPSPSTPGPSATAEIPDGIDLLVLSNLLNELPGDPAAKAATVMRWASHLSEHGTVLLVEPADLENATGLRAVQRELL